MRSAIIPFALLLLSTTQAQHGVGPLWKAEHPIPPVNPAHSQRGTLFNNMGVTSNGRAIVLTAEINPLNGVISGIYLQYSDDHGHTWSPPVTFTAPAGTLGTTPPKVLVDSDDNVHLLWSAAVPQAIFYSRYTDDLVQQVNGVQIANTGFSAVASHLTMDASGRLHAIWHEGNPGTGQTAEVFHARSDDGGATWTPKHTVSQIDGRHSAFPRGQYDAVQGNTIGIAWRDSVGGSSQWDIKLSVSTNAGDTWSTPTTVVAGTHMDSDPDLVIDDQDRFHLFWHRYPSGNPFNGAHVRYMFSDNNGATWNVAGGTQLSDAGFRSHLVEGCRYDAEHGVLWAVWKDERDFNSGNPQADQVLKHSLDRGLTWSTAEFASDRGASSIGFKASCVLPGGGLASNYEVTDPGTGLNRVFYRERHTAVTPSRTLFLNLNSHNEMTATEDYVGNVALFNNNVTWLTQIREHMLEHDAAWNFQTNSRFVIAALQHQGAHTSGTDILDALEDARVWIDPRNKTAVGYPYNIADVAHLLDSCGSPASDIVGGFVHWPYALEDWTQYQNPVNGVVYNVPWQANIIWGGGSLPPHTHDANNFGVWKPQSGTDSISFHTHAPSNHLWLVGNGCAPLVHPGVSAAAIAAEIIQHAQLIHTGAWPQDRFYSESLQFNQRDLSNALVARIDSVMDLLQPYVDAGMIIWCTTGQKLELFKQWSAAQGIASSQWACGQGVQVEVKAWLDGPYNSSTLLMDDGLRSTGLVPEGEPYTALGFGPGGGERRLSDALSITGSDAPVDWVRVELRASSNPATVVSARHAMIQRDGDITDLDGASPLTFNVPPGDYYVAVRHRNHLGAMTATTRSLSALPATVDLRTALTTTWGTDARKSVGNARLLWAGNTYLDPATSLLKYVGVNNDRDPILVRIGGTIPTATANGYFLEDVTLNGQVKYVGTGNDRDPILVNIGGAVPTNTRSEQLP